MKKILFLLTLSLCPLGFNAFAHDFEVDGIYYNWLSEEDQTVSVTYYGDKEWFARYSGDIVIPETVVYGTTTYRVTSVGDYAFEGCSELTSIEMPRYVENIGNWAFSGCTALTDVSIPSRVKSLGIGAFSFCSGLTNVTLPNIYTFQNIGNYAFMSCEGLTSITIPFRVRSIGDGAFMYCI